MEVNQEPSAKPVPAFRRPPQRPSWPAQMLDGWLLQRYALVVWATTGVRKRRPPLRFAKLSAAFRTIVSGQVFALFISLVLWVTGKKLSDEVFYLCNGVFFFWLLIFELSWLEKRLLRHAIPARFRKMDEGRRRLAWTCFALFWAAFSSIFCVAASLD